MTKALFWNSCDKTYAGVTPLVPDRRKKNKLNRSQYCLGDYKLYCNFIISSALNIKIFSPSMQAIDSWSHSGKTPFYT